MPDNERRYHVISYDIADPIRLGRIHRYLKKHAMPIQYSVFLTYCKRAALEDIITDLEEMIDPEADDVRFYTLPRKVEIITLGQQALAEGVQLLSGDANSYLRRL